MGAALAIPRVFHFTTRDISPEEARLVRRAMRVNPGWESRVWSDAENDALMARCFPEHVNRYRAIARGVVRADIARCAYLYVFGGVYLDTDYKVLRPVEAELEGRVAVLPISRGEVGAADFRLGNAVMASVPGVPFWREFLDELFADSRLTALAEGSVEAVTGPVGLTDFYTRRYGGNRLVHLPRRAVFHPQIRHYGLGYDREGAPVGVHLCWGSWRSKGFVQGLKTMSVRLATSF